LGHYQELTSLKAPLGGLGEQRNQEIVVVTQRFS